MHVTLSVLMLESTAEDLRRCYQHDVAYVLVQSCCQPDHTILALVLKSAAAELLRAPKKPSRPARPVQMGNPRVRRVLHLDDAFAAEAAHPVQVICNAPCQTELPQQADNRAPKSATASTSCKQASCQKPIKQVPEQCATSRAKGKGRAPHSGASWSSKQALQGVAASRNALLAKEE